MKPEIKKLHNVWESVVIKQRQSTNLQKINFDEILSSIFTSGPFYYFIIDFFDMSISNLSKGFSDAHGVEPGKIKNINDILTLIHPDDLDFVSKAEEKAHSIMLNKVGRDKFTSYKVSYNFRCKTAQGNYDLFNHQAIILTMDENNNFIKSLNIMTNLSLITKRNNYKLSLIGVGGEPSYLNLDVLGEELNGKFLRENCFSKREIQVLKFMAEGNTTKEIGKKLFISPETVETHRKNLLKKSACKNTVELVAKSMCEGWI